MFLCFSFIQINSHFDWHFSLKHHFFRLFIGFSRLPLTPCPTTRVHTHTYTFLLSRFCILNYYCLWVHHLSFLVFWFVLLCSMFSVSSDSPVRRVSLSQCLVWVFVIVSCFLFYFAVSCVLCSVFWVLLLRFLIWSN